ncbi:MAG: tetratricopeptide repeat protein [Candidatus Thermoplasmatota archaeon]
MAEEDATALFKKAKILASNGIYREAIEHYRKALSICPNFAEAYNELGNVHLTQGNIEDALSCYRRAVLYKPFYAEAWNNQAAALLIQGLYDEAIKCFKKVVELEPNNPSAWIAQGSLMFSLCKYSEALQCFNKALEIDPSSQEAIARRKDVVKQLEASKAKELKATKKICLLGDPMVGKTSLVRRYVYGMFVDKYLPTVGAKVTRKVISVFGREVTLTIWDITGLEDFKTIHPTYYLGANGALIICDALRPETLDRLPKWLDSILKIADRIPVLLLANKIDLAPRFYQEDSIKRLASELNTKYLLTSAKTGENVEKAFVTLTEEMVLK